MAPNGPPPWLLRNHCMGAAVLLNSPGAYTRAADSPHDLPRACTMRIILCMPAFIIDHQHEKDTSGPRKRLASSPLLRLFITGAIAQEPQVNKTSNVLVPIATCSQAWTRLSAALIEAYDFSMASMLR